MHLIPNWLHYKWLRTLAKIFTCFSSALLPTSPSRLLDHPTRSNFPSFVYFILFFFTSQKVSIAQP
jgi:hypothetical protein